MDFHRCIFGGVLLQSQFMYLTPLSRARNIIAGALIEELPPLGDGERSYLQGRAQAQISAYTSGS